jgi:FAD/FMN-containing dehydrogenase
VGSRRFAGLPGTLRFVVSSIGTALPACVAALREAGAELLVMPGLGLVTARAPADRAAALFDAAAHAARAGGGRHVCELAPPDIKTSRDVFAAPAPEVALSAALKARFDPHHVLNRGRFVGRL